MKKTRSDQQELISQEDMKKIAFEIVQIEDLKNGGKLSADKFLKLLNIQKKDFEIFEDLNQDQKEKEITGVNENSKDVIQKKENQIQEKNQQINFSKHSLSQIQKNKQEINSKKSLSSSQSSNKNKDAFNLKEYFNENVFQDPLLTMSQLQANDQTKIFNKIKKELLVLKKRTQNLQRFPIIKEQNQSQTSLIDKDFETLELMDTFIKENNKKQEDVKYKTKIKEFEEYDEKEELSKLIKNQKQNSRLKNFVQPHKQKNQTHDISSERAQSIMHNIFYNKFAAQFNPFFNKKQKEDPQIDYLARDLYNLSQYSLNEFIKKSAESNIDIVKDIRNDDTHKIVDANKIRTLSNDQMKHSNIQSAQNIDLSKSNNYDRKGKIQHIQESESSKQLFNQNKKIVDRIIFGKKGEKKIVQQEFKNHFQQSQFPFIRQISKEGRNTKQSLNDSSSQEQIKESKKDNVNTSSLNGTTKSQSYFDPQKTNLKLFQNTNSFSRNRITNSKFPLKTLGNLKIQDNDNQIFIIDSSNQTLYPRDSKNLSMSKIVTNTASELDFKQKKRNSVISNQYLQVADDSIMDYYQKQENEIRKFYNEKQSQKLKMFKIQE